MIKLDKPKIKINNCNSRYLTGEKILIEYQVFVKIRLRDYLIGVSMLIAEINNDYIVGVARRNNILSSTIAKINLVNNYEKMLVNITQQ